MSLKFILFCLSLASLSEAYDWNDYYSLKDTDDFLTGLLSFPENLSVTRYYAMGKTVNGRQIKAFEIEFVDDGLTIQYTAHHLKPSIFIEAGIYGNEWIAPAAATYLINKLVTLTGDHHQTLLLVKEFRWYIVPFVNPDGYEYSFTTNPIWRKNRKHYSSLCHGVDINRNFNFHWNEDGSSRNPCSSVYAGPGANSEKETRAVTKYLNSIPLLKAYISFQGYGAQILYPYGFNKTQHMQKEYELKRMTGVVAGKMKNYYGTGYSSGNMFDALYQVSGNGMDFAASKGLKLAFTFKLRPTVDSSRRASRRAPRSEILNTVVEAFNGVMLLAKDILNNKEVFDI